ncbi:MAG: aspartate aminotransferase family protein [Lachnospiraceae bacterium]|nr:aspartate aminotransferase family protein [Lachnospiraceae bacterium]
MTKTEQLIQEAEASLLHTYNRFPVVFERGEGVRLYDADGKEYLDFCAGIAVHALGYGNKTYQDALTEQIRKLTHTSNYFYNEPAIKAAKTLTKLTGMDRVFFTNSGAEAVEGAIKAARKYAFEKDGHTDHEIIAMEHSFHGRTMGALSITGTSAYREPFLPLIGHIRYATFNDLESVMAQVNDKTCAVVMETIQGEGGIIPATKEFIQGVRKLCDEKGLLLILDEVQCGMGRSGRMFAYEHYGVKPDIMTTAKGLGSGIPVGAFLMTEEVAAHSLKAGDHGSTYGGNPFAAAAINAVADQFEKQDILKNVTKTGQYMADRLRDLQAETTLIKEVRGMGLLQGIVLSDAVKAGDIAKKALQNGLVVVTAAGNVIRLIPPLIVTEKDVDEMIEKLGRALKP